MKKIILFAAILFAGFSVVKAQDGKGNTEDVKLQVELKAIQTLVVTGNDVNLKYETVKNYTDGVTKKMKKHLKIYSTGAFAVNVQAVDFSSVNNTKLMKLNTIEISATENSKEALTKTPKTPTVKLSVDEKDLITSNVGGFNHDFDVVYKGGANYRDLFVTGMDNVFTTTVTYTISAR